MTKSDQRGGPLLWKIVRLGLSVLTQKSRCLNFAWRSLLNDYLKRKKQAYAFVYHLLLTSIEQTVDFVCGGKTFNLMKV